VKAGTSGGQADNPFATPAPSPAPAPAQAGDNAGKAANPFAAAPSPAPAPAPVPAPAKLSRGVAPTVDTGVAPAPIAGVSSSHTDAGRPPRPPTIRTVPEEDPLEFRVFKQDKARDQYSLHDEVNDAFWKFVDAFSDSIRNQGKKYVRYAQHSSIDANRIADAQAALVRDE